MRNAPKDIYSVEFQITDRTIIHPVKSDEVIVPKGGSIEKELGIKLSKDRHAMDLTPQFAFKIITQSHIGWL